MFLDRASSLLSRVGLVCATSDLTSIARVEFCSTNVGSVCWRLDRATNVVSDSTSCVSDNNARPDAFFDRSGDFGAGEAANVGLAGKLVVSVPSSLFQERAGGTRLDATACCTNV